MIAAGINLLPAQRRAAGTLRRRYHLWMRIGMLAVVVFVGGWVVAGSVWPGPDPALALEIKNTRQRISQLNSRIQQQRRALQQLEHDRQNAAVLRDRPDWTILLRAISNELAESAYLSDLTVEPLPGAPGEASCRLGGVAASLNDVSRLVVRLERIGLFDNVQLVQSGRRGGDTSAVSFEITAALRERSSGGTPP